LWDKVPSEFHYNKHSWGVLSPHLSVISLVIHLEYLHTVFQVERIRCSESSDAITDLLDSAMQIVSAVTDFAKHRDQESSIREQYTWIVSHYYLYPYIVFLLSDLLGSTSFFFMLSRQQVLLQPNSIALQCPGCHYHVPSLDPGLSVI
jgi:hypothetical protein